MLKIGDFSRLSQVSVDTLRHYDMLGLLKPTEVDTFTGYRYYAFHQLGRLNRILALKDLGLSLGQIAQMMEGDVSAEQLKGMLKFKRAEIEQHIDTQHERLARVEARLKQIEMEANMPNHEVVIKIVKPLLIGSIRRVMPAHDKITSLYDELNAYLMQQGVTPSGPITIWHTESGESDIDAEAAITLKARVPETGTVKVYELPGGSMASTVHNGPYTQLHQAYQAIQAWVEANGYQITGPAREFYLYYANEGSLNFEDPSYVTEIQFPVEKV